MFWPPSSLKKKLGAIRFREKGRNTSILDNAFGNWNRRISGAILADDNGLHMGVF
jgi:hypothetical protein